MPDVYTTKGWSTLRRAAHKASSISVAERSLTQPRRASGFSTLSSPNLVDVKQHRYLASPVPSQCCSQCWRPSPDAPFHVDNAPPHVAYKLIHDRAAIVVVSELL